MCHAVDDALRRIQDQRVCPECGKTTVFWAKDKRGWVCRKPQGGCGAAFAADDARVKHGVAPRIGFHDLRHSHVNILAAVGANPKAISERLGHASVGFTLQTYGHVLPHQQRNDAARIDALFRGERTPDSSSAPEAA